VLTPFLHRVVLISAILGICGVVRPVAAESVTDARRLFAEPPREYSSAPLWVWNDTLTEEHIVETMRDLAGQKVRQVFVHPRPGLMTPYLSEDWFRLWKVALREAERLDMNVWIYDENSYPSGFAGGLVPEAMPESRGKGLVWKETATPPEPGEGFVAVFRESGDGYENVTDRIRAGDSLTKGRYLIASIRLAPEGGWFGGKWYVDLLKPGVTEKFIEITMERYRREIGEQFGKRMPGWFTDEPHLAPAGGLHWSDHLPELFQKRWGYDLVDHLPSLTRTTGDWKRVRHNYYNLLLEQFIERWAKPCYEYCETHDLEFTGHYWEHGWPEAGHGGDNMAMYAWHQRPAIDTLMNRYSEDVHAQFGNARAVKELASVANQLGRRRTLCEAYGAGGWDLRFEDMKRIGDWLYVLGVNTLDEHLSYITIRGARKRDHPQSFSYHEPWWDAYHVMAEYFTRLSLIMSQGRQINHILVLEPTTTTWMYQGDSVPAGRLGEIGNRFQTLLMSLEKAQVEYDLGCEDIMGRHGSMEGSHLRIGQRRYDIIVLPSLTENLNPPTMELLEKYLQAGGEVWCCGAPPVRVDGHPSDRGHRAAEHAGWRRVETSEVPGMLLARTENGFAIQRTPDDRGILFHHRRVLDDGQFLLLVNTSIESPSAGTVISAMRGVQAWDLFAGKVRRYPFARNAQGIRADFELPPSGSLLLFLSEEASDPSPVAARKSRLVPPSESHIERVQPNVLTLDYVDITAGGETRRDVYFYRANQFAWQKNGMERNPWDSAVQLRDGLITKTFPPDSGFTAGYKFTLEQSVPESLTMVIERPDLYSITCNGQTVVAAEGSWWLDKAFGRIDITDKARVGENTVTVKAQPFTMLHELEPAYVLGDFAVKPADRGFVIAPEERLSIVPSDEPSTHDANPDHLLDGSGLSAARRGWRRQGLPFYGAGVAYRQRFQIAQPQGEYVVSLPDWYGSVARVGVNGKPVGHIVCPPWECDVTEHVKPGNNEIEVVVIGTLKNTLGPHHGNPGLGSAWPGMFQQAPEAGPPPGRAYHTIDYGLFEPFELKQVTRE
jgi:hypothetical protein